MYPQPTNFSPSTSNATPKPTSIFQPSSTDNSTESSPQSSLPCGQRMPAASTSYSDAPSSHTPPQPFVHPQHQPKIPTPTQHISPNPTNNKLNKHLLKQMLTSLLSLPFQMKVNSMYPKPQIVVRSNAVNNSQGSKMNTFPSTATCQDT